MHKVYRILRDCTIRGREYKVGETPTLPEEVGDSVMDDSGHAIAKPIGASEIPVPPAKEATPVEPVATPPPTHEGPRPHEHGQQVEEEQS